MEPQKIPLTFQGGAVDQYSPTMLVAGESVEVQNWVPEGNGQLRVRHHWINEIDEGAPAIRRGRGLHHHAFNADQRYLIAATERIEDTTQRLSLRNWNGRDEIQTLRVVKPLQSGTFTLTYDGAETTPITFTPDWNAPIALPYNTSHAVTQQAIQDALDTLPNTDTGDFFVTPGYFTTPAAVPGSQTCNIQTVSLFDPNHERHATGGTFTLTFDGQTTGNITYNGDVAVLGANIIAALVALPNVEPVDVEYIGAYSETARQLMIRFQGQYAFRQQPLMTMDPTNLTGAADFDETKCRCYDGIKANGTGPYNRLYGSREAKFVGLEFYIWAQGSLSNTDIPMLVDTEIDLDLANALTMGMLQTPYPDGIFTLQVPGYPITTSLKAAPSASDIETALEAADPDLGCSVIDLGDVNGARTYDITFNGALAGTQVPVIDVDKIDGPPAFTAQVTRNPVGYELYQLQEGVLAWVKLGEIGAQERIPAVFASGAAKLAVLTPGSELKHWDGTTWTDDIGGVGEVPADAQALAFHKSRFFLGVDTTLWYSRLLDITLWTDEVTAIDNSIPVGALDGERIEALCSYEDLLIVGKRNSMWMLSGSSSATFALRRMVGGGVAPGRTLVPTPYGLVAIGEHAVWMYTGGPWQIISGNIRESYGITGDFMTGAYCAGSVYICDSGSGTTWVYNCETGAWSTEVPGDLNEGPALLYGKADYLYSQPKDALTNSLVMYRQMPSGQRRQDENMAQDLRATTGTTWFGTAVKPYTIRQLNLRVRQDYGDASSAPLIITPVVDGEARTPYSIQPRNNPPHAWRERMSLGGTGWGAYFEFVQELASGDEGGLDIEEVILEVDIEEAR